MKKDKKQTKQQKKKGNLLQNIRKGRSVSLDFFARNVWFFLFFIAAIIALIGLRYSTQSKQVKVQQLERELSLSENEKVVEKAKYMTLIRETEMRKLIKSQKLDLDFQEQPPYRITKTENQP